MGEEGGEHRSRGPTSRCRRCRQKSPEMGDESLNRLLSLFVTMI